MDTNRAWFIDVSDWEDPWDLCPLAQEGCLGIIIKSSMGLGNSKKIEGFINAASKANMLYGFYHWADPIYSMGEQTLRFSGLIKKYKPDFIASDNEQWWSSWEKWYDYMNHKIPYQDVPRFGMEKLDAFFHNFMRDVQHLNPDLLFLNYTAGWFIKAYAPHMAFWTQEFPLWDAYYVLDDTRRYQTFASWDAFHRTINALNRTVFPPGAKSYCLWQFASRWRLPGMTSCLDLNVFGGTRQEFLDLAQVTLPDGDPIPKPKPAAYTEQRVVATFLNVREGPGVEYKVIGWKAWGNIVKVYETTNGWARIEDPASQWVKASWLRPL